MTRRCTLVLMAFASVVGLLLMASPAVRAEHVAPDAPSCYKCHNLGSSETEPFTEPGTRWLLFWTLDEFKKAGWSPGRHLGCTYCHRDVNAPSIPDVLTYFKYDWSMNRYFSALPSHHPVTKGLDNSYDNTAFLSSDNTYTPNHLDCIDCHDQTLVTYPNHDNDTWLNDNNLAPPGRRKSTNPFALRNVTAPKAYDDLCRSCHSTTGAAFTEFTNRGGAQPGKTPPAGGKLILSSHALGTDNGSGAIRDLDNTNLRPQDQQQAAKKQCTVCHDAHKSSNYHLFSDGYESGSETPVDEDACATVCHYQGDPQGNFLTKGHGKLTFWDGQQFFLTCTDCHSSAVPHNRNATDYLQRYRFATLPDNDLITSVFGNKIITICGKCHDYKTHGTVGCIDCHDPHAKNSDNNFMMIRSTNKVAGSRVGVSSGRGSAVGTENVVFYWGDKYPVNGRPAPYDFVTNDNLRSGVCDQRACHGATTVSRKINGVQTNVPIWPMATFLSTDNGHSGGKIPIENVVNTNCAKCHMHNDPYRSFSAESSCTVCHGQPPPPSDIDYPYNEARSPHLKHAGNLFTSGQYGFVCQACHANYTDPSTHNTQPPTYQNVVFGPDWDNGAAAYNAQFMRCSATTCHSDGRGGNPDCTTFQWYVLDNLLKRSTLGCTDCHKHRSPMLATGAHPVHLSAPNVLPCATCHYGIVATDNDFRITLPNRMKVIFGTGTPAHVNNVRDVVINPAYDDNGTFAWNPNDNTCFGVTCHGGRSVRWSPPQVLTCVECHGYVTNTPVPATVYDYTFQKGLGAMSKVSPAMFTDNGHGNTAGLPWDPARNPGATPLGPLSCLTCHDRAVLHENNLNPFRFQGRINDNAVSPGNVDTVCTACHVLAGRSLGHDNGVTGGGQRKLSHLQRCVDCHDVHGQRNIYMVYDNLPWQVHTDNTNSNAYGIPHFPANRSLVYFRSVDNGSSFASVTNDGLYTDGVCETCHTVTRQYANGTGSGGPNGHPTRTCIECHHHAMGFGGLGGSNVEQYFDRVFSDNNFRDLSGHPLAMGDNANQVSNNSTDCLRCHGKSPLGSGKKSNECLKCHYETLPISNASVYHPDGKFQWAIPGSAPNGVFTIDNLDLFCLQCHGKGDGKANLNGNAPAGIPPDNILMASGEDWWNPSSGHGATSTLSDNGAVGPPAYSCRDCHYSSVPMDTSSNARDNGRPTFHASINRKMVGNTDNAIHEYPHPSDPDPRYNTTDLRSGQMDWFCGTRCHGNLANAPVTKDDGVVRHTWDKLKGGSQADSQSHPSDVAIPPGLRYRTPDNLPLSEYLTGTLPGSGNVVCVTCHNPHGGASGLRADNGALLTGGAKQMMRRSFSGDNGAVCKECHQ